MKIIYNNIYSSGEINISLNELSEKVKITPNGLVLHTNNEEDEFLTIETFEMAQKTFERLVNAYTNQRNGYGLVRKFDLSVPC